MNLVMTYPMRTMLTGCLILAVLVSAAHYSPPLAAEGQSKDRSKAKEAAESALTAQAGDMKVRIARWYDDKAAAISLQFEGSHPSHLKIAIPVLNGYGEYGVPPLVGTFFLNPESDGYQAHRAEWEKAIAQDGHELGRDTIKAPQVFRVGTAAGKVDLHNIQMFKQQVEESIAKGEWASFSFHAIGEESGLGIGQKSFLQMMDYLKLKNYRWQTWIGGVSQIHKYQTERNAAKVSAHVVDPFKVKIEVDCATDPKIYDQPLTVRVDFRPRWPHYHYDIEVLDAAGNPIPVRRAQIARNSLLIPVSPKRGTYYVHIVDPRKGQPTPPDKSARSVRDPTTGLSATICKWFDGRRAAVSFRFDDSHPTHILKAIPLLREYGFKGTFFINPGNADYQAHREAWEACAAQGDQEFANHTLHHRGASNDQEIDREVGEVSRYIWNLFPGKNKLHAFAEGGGTVWTHSKPFRYYLDKYHLFSAYGVFGISMADSYGKRVEAYRQALTQAIEQGKWFSSLYHQIGTNISDDNFRAALDITQQHQQELWIAGMADIYKYERERASAQLSIHSKGPDVVMLKVSCGTNPQLYDQPLTIQLTLPTGWSAQRLKLSDAKGKIIPVRAATPETVVRFEVPPSNAVYSISNQ